jgi:nucleotide-binding universal stress UspA family protein
MSGTGRTVLAVPAAFSSDFGHNITVAFKADGRVEKALLVMGAYAHSAWCEALLGGVTQHVLATAAASVLMRH